MTKLRILFITILFSFVGCHSHDDCLDEETLSPSQEVNHFTKLNNTILAKRIDSLFEQALDDNTYVGAGISVVLEDQVLYEKAFGYKDYGKRSKMDIHSVFRVGSLSKSFTGTLCGILHQEGLFSYEEPIYQVIDNFSLANPAFTNKITIGHLLSHTAGFPYHSYTNLIEDGLTMSTIVPYFATIKNLQPPGSQYSYQNAAFALSGLFLERKYNTALSRLYKDKLFVKIGMDQTSTDYKSLIAASNIAYPHNKTVSGWNKGPINKKYYNAIPAGGINTTTHDMSKFLLLLLGNRPELLSVEQIGMMTKPVIETEVSYRYYKKWPSFKNTFYSYGWRIHVFGTEEEPGENVLVHHGGQVNGYRSEIAFSTKENFAISVLFNSSTPLAKTIIPELVSMIGEYREISIL